MTAEQWRDVAGFDGVYQVSDLGRVRSLDRIVKKPNRWGGITSQQLRGRVLAPGRKQSGHLHVSLTRYGAKRLAHIHTLVLEGFVGPRPADMQGCHGDGNPANNALSNLRWGTCKANHDDMLKHGSCFSRGRHFNARKLVPVDVERIRDLRRAGCLQRDLAVWLGVGAPYVSDILRGKRWAHAA